MTDPAAPAVPAPDLDIGSFSDDPPWTVDPAAISWLAAVPATRAACGPSCPTWSGPGGCPGVRVVRVAGHIGWALGGWVAVERRRGGSTSRADISRRLRIAAEHLGPTYIKLGQIISSGDGLFPEELVGEFKKCRDQVPPEPFPVVRDVVEADLASPSPRSSRRSTDGRWPRPRSPRSTPRR